MIHFPGNVRIELKLTPGFGFGVGVGFIVGAAGLFMPQANAVVANRSEPSASVSFAFMASPPSTVAVWPPGTDGPRPARPESGPQ